MNFNLSFSGFQNADIVPDFLKTGLLLVEEGEVEGNFFMGFGLPVEESKILSFIEFRFLNFLRFFHHGLISYDES